MFDIENRYITKGIKNEVDGLTQIYMWQLIDNMEIQKDYLQVFTLSKVIKDGCMLQQIVHQQEQPIFKESIVIPAQHIINEKVYVIDDGDHSTMLLASEY